MSDPAAQPTVKNVIQPDQIANMWTPWTAPIKVLVVNELSGEIEITLTYATASGRRADPTIIIKSAPEAVD